MTAPNIADRAGVVSANGPDMTALRKSAEKPEEVAETTLLPRELDIDVKYPAPDGVRRVATLHSHILTLDERRTVGAIFAKLSGGVPFASLPTAVSEALFMYAWLSVSLDDPPEWFQKFASEDEFLLATVYGEVRLHEAAYFRRSPEEGEPTSEEGRLVVSSLASSTSRKE